MTSEWLAVGAPGRNGHVGAVYVYRLKHRFDDTGTAVPFWELQQMLLPPQDEVQSFGAALAISDNRLIIGAPQYAHGAGRAGLVAFLAQEQSDHRFRLTAEFKVSRSVKRVDLSCGSAMALGVTRLRGVAQVYRLPEFARGAECATP